MKCEVSGKVCDDNCPTQYDTGNMGEIIENLEAISKALEQEPFINKPCVSSGVCEHDKNKVLDKVRAEIEQLPTKTRTNWDGCCPDIDYPEIEYVDVTKDKLLDIIDKYQEADLIDATYKALEEEICEDAISRKDMALNIVSFYNKATGKKKTLDFLCKCVEGLPSVQPKQRWIPVGERLPKDDERILVTRRMFHWANEPVEYAVGIESFSGNVDFIAWMPLPEPYKAEIEPQEK